DHAIGRKMCAVAEDVLVDIADAKAVHVDITGRYAFFVPRALLVDFEDIAVGQDECLTGGHSDGFGELRMNHEVTVFAVDGQEILRLKEALDDLQLFAAGMAAYVDVRNAVVEDFGAEAEEVIDVAVDGLLIARDGTGGEDD